MVKIINISIPGLVVEKIDCAYLSQKREGKPVYPQCAEISCPNDGKISCHDERIEGGAKVEGGYIPSECRNIFLGDFIEMKPHGTPGGPKGTFRRGTYRELEAEV
ncbi:MAG: hypothetical protein WA139_00925 [Candidatus Aenigmatarchaeota archaeon]